MRRYHHLRFDIWLCLALSLLLSLGTAQIAKWVAAQTYGSYVEEHTVADGDIGGRAGDEVYRAQNVRDLLTHDTFTIISPGIEYRNRGGGYHEKGYMHAVTLPSGERVAALINLDAVQNDSDSIFSGNATLPVGRVVREDLSENETFLDQIQFSQPLARTDFYIDMLGHGGAASQEDYAQYPVMITQLVTILAAFPLLHALGSRLGLFPYFFPPKGKNTAGQR